MLGDICVLSEKPHLLFRLQMSMKKNNNTWHLHWARFWKLMHWVRPYPNLWLHLLCLCQLDCGEAKPTARVTKSILYCFIWPEHFDPANFFRYEAFIVIPIWQVKKLRQGRAKYEMCSLVWGCLTCGHPTRRLFRYMKHPELTPTEFRARGHQKIGDLRLWVLAAACLTLGIFLKIQSQEHGHTGPHCSPCRAVHLHRQHRGDSPPWQGSASWLVSERHVRRTGPRQVKFAACKLWLELKICCEVVCPSCQKE